MNHEFIRYLRTHTKIGNDDIERVSSLAIRRPLRRNEFVFHTGEICQHKIFVLKGLLRTFGTSDDGSEHIVQFSPENSWTLDAESYDRQVPSLVSIAAVETSDILLWNKTNFDTLLQEIPGLKVFAGQIISRNIYYSRQRILTALSASPEEKYADFVERFPGLLSRLPLRMIAAYLGISIKTLTRVRLQRR